MAPTTLAPGFSLRQANQPDELATIFTVCMIAIAEDPLYKRATGSTTDEDLLKWFMEHLSPRWAAPDITTWVVVEDATQKIVAWTALQFPWKYREMSDELKAKIQSNEEPPLLDTMQPEAMLEFFATLECTKPYGYDMEKDYHRKGTMVLPDFQKRGFGTVLTRHCNAITDKSGDRTFVPARPTSQKMFEDQGYKVLGYHDSHIERWGDDISWSKTAILLREPQAAQA